MKFISKLINQILKNLPLIEKGWNDYEFEDCIWKGRTFTVIAEDQIQPMIYSGVTLICVLMIELDYIRYYMDTTITSAAIKKTPDQLLAIDAAISLQEDWVKV